MKVGGKVGGKGTFAKSRPPEARPSDTCAGSRAAIPVRVILHVIDHVNDYIKFT